MTLKALERMIKEYRTISYNDVQNHKSKEVYYFEGMHDMCEMLLKKMKQEKELKESKKELKETIELVREYGNGVN